MNIEAPAAIYAQASLDTATTHITQLMVEAYVEAIEKVKSGNLDRQAGLDLVKAKTVAAYDIYPQFDETDVSGHCTFESTRPLADLREEFDKVSMSNYDEAFEETVLNVEAYRADLEAYTTRLVRLEREGGHISSLQLLQGLSAISSYSSLADNIMAVRAVEKRDGLEDEMRANLQKIKEILRKITK